MTTMELQLANMARGGQLVTEEAPWQSRMIRSLPHVLFAAASAVFVLTVVTNHGLDFSVFDEYVYYDYVVKVPAQGIVRQGEFLGTEAKEILSCYGSEPFGLIGEPCGSDYADNAAYPLEGKTSGDLYTPVYFVATWIGARLFQLAGGLDLLTAARLTGMVWLAATLSAMYLAFRRFGVPAGFATVVCFAFLASPFSWWTYTYISTDAPSALFGAIALILTHRYLSGTTHPVWLVLLSAVAVLTKVNNIFVPGLIVLAILFANLMGEPNRLRWRALKVQPLYGVWLLAIAGVPTVLQVIWMVVHAQIGVDQPPDQGVSADWATSWGGLTVQIVNFIPGTIVSNATAGSPPVPIYEMPGFLTVPLSWLTIVGVLGAVAIPESSNRWVHRATAVAGLMFAPVLTIAMSVAVGSSFAFPARYGAPLLPAFLLGFSVICRSRGARVATGVYVAVLCAVVFLRMVDWA